MTIAGQLSLMRFIGAPQEHEDNLQYIYKETKTVVIANLQYIYKETKTVVIASVLWASVLQCVRPLRWLPAYSLEYPRGRLENRAGSLSLWR